MTFPALFLALLSPAATDTTAKLGDTVHVEVGSKEVDGRVYKPHAARVRGWVGPGQGRMRAEWTNVLTVGDSAGREVHRWVTTVPLAVGVKPGLVIVAPV